MHNINYCMELLYRIDGVTVYDLLFQVYIEIIQYLGNKFVL